MELVLSTLYTHFRSPDGSCFFHVRLDLESYAQLLQPAGTSDISVTVTNAKTEMTGHPFTKRKRKRQ